MDTLSKQLLCYNDIFYLYILFYVPPCVKTEECKVKSIAFNLSSFLLLVSLLFSFLLPILTMCLQINTITTTRKPRITHCRQRNPNNLRTLPMSANTLLYFSIGLWNCQSAVNKADLITSITSHSRLNLMALTETWIKLEDNATPAASPFPTPPI